MRIAFNETNLRLARQCQSYSLNEVGEAVGTSRQYIHRLETGRDTPTPDLAQRLAHFLKVQLDFFYKVDAISIAEEAYHFRKLASTRVTTKQAALAKGELFRRLVDFIDSKLRLPVCDFPSYDAGSPEEIERIAERCRSYWGLGFGPIDNVIRVAENAGAVVTTFHEISNEVDALSIAARRPVVVTNNSKGSACRVRFDIAHEIGHFVMHEAIQTGDRATENEANRFAGAFLLPRSTFVKAFPAMRGSSLNWSGISQLKMEWKVSKAAILYRARQLGLISESQYKSGIIYGLNRKGEATNEKEDRFIPHEHPEMIFNALKVLNDKLGIDSNEISNQTGMTPDLLRQLLPPMDFSESILNDDLPSNVVRLAHSRKS